MAYHRPIPESKSRRGLAAGGFRSLVEAERLMQIAFVMPSAVLIGWAGGWWLASVTHWKWLEIAGVLFGCVTGLFYVVQMAIAAEKKMQNPADKAGSAKDEAQNGPGKGMDSGQR